MCPGMAETDDQVRDPPRRHAREARRPSGSPSDRSTNRRTMKNVAVAFLLLSVPGCASSLERAQVAQQRAFAEVQPMANFELRCPVPASLQVLQAYKVHPITVGASCEGRQVAFTRPLRTHVWYRADQVPAQWGQPSFVRDVA
ncbi:MAG: hypothetical protein JWN04_4727, partial [Myxococcaceae bacterium]|nr:hypothetical protein [Myxococcaceae bacterium]